MKTNTGLDMVLSIWAKNNPCGRILFLVDSKSGTGKYSIALKNDYLS